MKTNDHEFFIFFFFCLPVDHVLSPTGGWNVFNLSVSLFPIRFGFIFSLRFHLAPHGRRWQVLRPTDTLRRRRWDAWRGRGASETFAFRLAQTYASQLYPTKKKVIFVSDRTLAVASRLAIPSRRRPSPVSHRRELTGNIGKTVTVSSERHYFSNAILAVPATRRNRWLSLLRMTFYFGRTRAKTVRADVTPWTRFVLGENTRAERKDCATDTCVPRTSD